MKGDPLSVRQIIEKYGNPIDALAGMHFDCLAQAEQHEAAGETQESQEARKAAETCRKDMAKYGFAPAKVDGVPKALRMAEE
jgi:hypothetical protein